MKIESIVNHVHTLSCTAAAPRIGDNWKEPPPLRERPERPAKAQPRKRAFIAAASVIMWFAMFPAFLAVGRCGDAATAHQLAHLPAHPSADQPAKPAPPTTADRSLCRT